MKTVALAIILLSVSAASRLNAAPFTLTFEGLSDREVISNYYNGGLGANGSGPGPNYGVTFGVDSEAFIQSNHGGTGNFGGAPSGFTAETFFGGFAQILNTPAGFTTGLSLYYTVPVQSGQVGIFSGLDGTGTLLATLPLPTTPDGRISGCPDNPGAQFCPFLPAGIAFSGTARSVETFVTTGRLLVGGEIGFDNITFGSTTPLGPVPEPGSLATLFTGLASLALARFSSSGKVSEKS